MTTTPNEPQNNESQNITTDEKTVTNEQTVSSTTPVAPELTHQQTAPKVDQPQPVVEPIVTPKPVKKKWDVTHWLLGAVVAGGIAFFANHFGFLKLPSFTQKIAVVDTAILAMAISVEVTEEIKSGQMTLQQSESVINAYIKRMYEEAESYAKDGYTVIPSQNVIFYSDKHDLTETIAKKLGVDYSAGVVALQKNNMKSTVTQGDLFKPSAIANQSQLASLGSNPNVNFEDHTKLELQTNNGETSDLAIFDGQE